MNIERVLRATDRYCWFLLGVLTLGSSLLGYGSTALLLLIGVGMYVLPDPCKWRDGK